MISNNKPKLNGNILWSFLTFTLCFCVLFTQYPVSSIADAEQPAQYEAAWYNGSGDPLFGSLPEAIGNVAPGGTVILLSDVSLSEGITVSKPMTITSANASAPFTVKNHTAGDVDKEEIGRIFTYTGSGDLILQNIILDGGKNNGVTAYHPLICVTGGGVLRMLEGTVLQNAGNKSQGLGGGGVNIRYGQLYMYDGSKITDCKAVNGGGVELNSKSKSYEFAVFGMAGGSIENCEANEGGGVYINIGMFQMQGGKISRNSAEKNAAGSGGGGIYISGGYKFPEMAAVLVGGGEITDNTAGSTGGGILVNGSCAQLEIAGGTIKGNYSDSGGGVSVIQGTLSLYGGTVTENTADLYGGGILGAPGGIINLWGDPKVFGNIANDKEDSFDNLYLDGNREGQDTATKPIILKEPLTDGVRLGMTRWIRPDEENDPYWEMIVPDSKYSITQADLDRLCYDRADENKQLYADNMEKYAFIPYDGKIVMVLAVDIELDRDKLAFKELSSPPVTVGAAVTPDSAPEKGVTWSSSDENVAIVDANGKVTPVGKGTATITAATRSPYHAAAACGVTVGHQLTTEAVNGKHTYTPVESNGFFLCGDEVILKTVANTGYRFKSYRADDNSAELVITDNKLTMPNHDVTVEAVFEPISYPISCDTDGGELKAGETNPASYTIESGEITLKNPIKSGYVFAGWTGTGLTEAVPEVKIPSGSTGAREYTAHWEKAYRLTVKAEHGDILYTSAKASEFFTGDEELELKPVADNGYQLCSLKAYRSDDSSVRVSITDNKLTMPNHDVTVEAVFEPISYPISCDPDGGELRTGETNPASYTIESGEITLKNPVKSGYVFTGWTGTGLTGAVLEVKIPSGSTGAREYTAVWEKNVYRLTTRAEHGDIIYTAAKASAFFPRDEVIALEPVADNGYRLCSLKAYRSDDSSAEVVITDNSLSMPDHDVTVEAVFEPISYPISYDPDGGELRAGETNPSSYTIESGEITLKNPVKSGYVFTGWTGTGLTGAVTEVKIPSGSTGAREYTAVWEAENNSDETPPDAPPSTGGENKPNIPAPPVKDDVGGSDPTTSDESGLGGGSVPNGSEPTESGETESGETESSETESSETESSETESSAYTNGSSLPLDENASAPGESASSENRENPATGIAISCLPLAAAVVVLTLAAKHKKK